MCNSNTSVRRRSPRIPRALASPVIPSAFIDGLLPAALLSAPVPVTFPVWDEAVGGDAYQLSLDGILIGVERQLPANPIPGSELVLDILVDTLTSTQDGNHTIAYRTERFIGGTPSMSATIPVVIDRQAPGGSLISPLIFPRVVNDGLTSEELAAMADVLIGEVPAYFDIKTGDEIQTYWAGKVGPTHTVRQTEVPGGGVLPERITIGFSRDFLEGIGDVKADVYYVITDRAGNVSVESEPVAFQLALNEPAADLPAPIIAQADDGVISDVDAKQSVSVDIPAYGDVRPGDEITLYWGANKLPVQPVNPGDEDEDPIFTLLIAYATIALTPDGNVDVYYEVRRNTLLLGTSAVKTVTVLLALPGPVSPEKPIIRGASANPDDNDNVIDENDYLQSATAVIAWKSGFIEDDQLNLFWGQQPAPVQYRITLADVTAARDLSLTVPNALIISEGTGTDIRVNYTVTHAGNPNTTYSASQSVVVRRKGELPGGENGLPPPEFQRVTENGGIGAILNPNGATVLVKPYENVKVGDILSFTFLGWTGLFEGPQVPGATYTFTTEPLTEPQTREDYEFTVPDANLRLICFGRAEAMFKVDSVTGPATSGIAKVFIDMVTAGEGCSGN
ncbi:MAG: hypothetical protein JWR17_2221 [Pseudomonas sp.]|uniref:addiction module component n=1 Tax=Pseudomonas sp. TaxID=306 RepID=UPI002618F89A|nr:addiction module component [Pseudomonas sp.]MDB6049475.1 hypothetical protein [Pseudomonas sp.]